MVNRHIFVIYYILVFIQTLMEHDGRMNKDNWPNTVPWCCLLRDVVMHPTCSQLIKRIMRPVHVLCCSWHPSIHVLLLPSPLVLHTYTHTHTQGPRLKQVTFQPSCGGLQSCVLCCVWVWGPRIAHTPPAIHWPWAAPFMCKRPGWRGRGGGEGCWLNLSLFHSLSWPHLC